MAAAAFTLNAPLAPVDAALNSINANHGLPPLPGGARKVFSSPSELDTDYGVSEADLQYLIDEGCSLPNVFSICLEPLDSKRMGNAWRRATLTATTSVLLLRNTFKMNIQGHNERERGQAFYRAMMGQSDAVKVAMLKHRPHQRPVNHRTTSVPSTRHASARRVPPRSCAHESRRLQRRDARPHPAPPCVLPPLRLGASRCARTFV